MMFRSQRRSRWGGAALEAALVTPVLITLALGIIDFTWYIISLESVVLAAQAGARAGAQTPLTGGPAAAAVTAAQTALRASFPAGTPVGDTYTTTLTGNILRVTVDTAYTPLVGLVPIPATLRATVAMRIEDLT